MKIIAEYDVSPRDEENVRDALEVGDYSWLWEILSGYGIEGARIVDEQLGDH